VSVIAARKLANEHRGRPEEETIGKGSLNDKDRSVNDDNEVGS
jgi:hypothetical protein